MYNTRPYSSARSVIDGIEGPDKEGEPPAFAWFHSVLGEVAGEEAFSFLAPHVRQLLGVASLLVSSEKSSGASGHFGDPFTRRGFFVGESVTEAEERESFFSSVSVSTTDSAAVVIAAFRLARLRRAALSLFWCRAKAVSRARNPSSLSAAIPSFSSDAASSLSR